MRIEDVEYFLQVSQAGAISKAAQSLGMAQPSLSKAISRLEGELKTRLFERHAAGVKLTPEGSAFHEHARRMALHAADAATALRELRQGASGVVRVGLGVGVPASVFARACSKLLEHGSVRFELSGGMTDTLLSELTRGTLDLVVSGVPQPMDDDIAWERLWSDPLVPMLPRGHPLARRRTPLTLRDLLSQRWVLPARGTVARKRFDSAFITEGLSPPDATVDSRGSGREFELSLALGAITLLPQSIVHDSGVKASMVPLRAPAALTIERTVALLSRRHRHVSPVVTRFIQHLSKSGRQFAAQ